MIDEMLSCIQQKFEELIANAYMTFQKGRGAKHGAQLLQKHHFEAKEFMRKITKKKANIRRFLTASRMMTYFMLRLRENNRHYAPCPCRTTKTIRCVVIFFDTIQNLWREAL